MANSRDNGMGVSKGLLLWFHLNPLQRLFPSCLPLPTPPARPSSGPGCFCRAAGCRDGSPVTEDASAGHCPSTQAWGTIYLQHRKFTQRTNANMTHTQLISEFFYHPVLAPVSFQSPGARSQMSHHTCVSETKAQNTSEAFFPMLLSILHPQPLNGHPRSKGTSCRYLPNGSSCSPSRGTSKSALVRVRLPASLSHCLITDSWYFLSSLHEFCPSKQQPVLFYDVL